MALNLSTLTSPATSGDVLAEVLTTADFLEPTPVLRNLARGSNKGGDAEQDVALNQPKALPLIDGDGYLYLSGVSGNYATLDSPILPNSSFDVTIDFVWGGLINNGLDRQTLISQYLSPDSNRFFVSIKQDDSTISLFHGGSFTYSSEIVIVGRNTVRLTYDGATLVLYLNDVQAATKSASGIQQEPTYLGAVNLATDRPFKGAIFSVTEGSNTNVDFTSTNVRHGDTKFRCATGQVVTINQDSSSSNDVATIIKKPVLRFDGANDFMGGLLNQTIDGGYMFAAFSVLGDGGEDTSRIFSVNNTGGTDGDSQSAIFSLRNNSVPDDLFSYQAQWISGHSQMFDDDNGDILHESLIKNGTQKSLVNNAGVTNHSNATTISAEEFNIVSNATGLNNSAIDLEYLALFPSSITDEQADAVRNYINKRNNVFYRWDTDGYYFFDPQKATFTGNFTAANTLDGYITGSDLGDTDVRSNLTLEQATLNDQPYADGYKITFNDSAEHLEFDNAASQTLAGWQVVGASRGTFVYKVNANAVTELNLLGNAGTVRQAGYLYGIILLPESATGADIEQARKLLIDRGAADGTVSTNIYRHFDGRSDIVDFKYIATSSVTNNANFAWRNCSNMTSFAALDLSHCPSFTNTWQSCSSLTSFPADAKLGTSAQSVNIESAWQQSGLTSFSTPLPTVTYAAYAFYSCASLASFSSELPLATNLYRSWEGCSSLSDFKTTDIKNCTNFTSAWQGCTALTSFPSDALLGTEANNVNFSSAWQSSGLTSFPSDIDLSKGTNFFSSWFGCSSLTSFPSIDLSNGTNFYASWYLSGITNFSASAKLGENAINVSFREAFRASALTSFSTPLNNGNHFFRAWRDCNSLVDFSVDVFTNWNPSSISSGVFNQAWDGCTALTAQSVENILTSIDASGQYATSDGDAYVNGVNTQLADSGIDIDYDGSGLTAATTAAIDSLSGKGWEVYINGVLVIPNILDLEPAAAYSLRSFDADADPNVVNVRRSSDNATSDFTASEVSDGTLVAWVGAGNDGHVTTWYDQGGTNHATQATASSQPKIVDGGTLVTEGGQAALDFDEASDQHIVMSYSDLYGQSRLDSFYVTSTSDNTYLYPARTTSGSYHGLVADDGAVFSYISGSNYGTVNAYANNTLFTGTTRDEYHAATVGYKLISHENAQTVDWDSFNFGRYGTAVSSYSYTGKLQEMIFFNTDQSANRTGIENNINDHFDIYS